MTTPKDREQFENLIRKELYHYHEIKSDCNMVIDYLWKLIQAIEDKQILTITYYKMNREQVKRKIRPASILFSEYYFYLIAYDADDETCRAKYFRVDRIVSIVTHRERFSLKREYDFDEGDLREKNQFMFPKIVYDHITIRLDFMIMIKFFPNEIFKLLSVFWRSHSL